MKRSSLWLVIGLALLVLAVGFTGCSAGTGAQGPLSVNLNGQQQGIWVTGQGKMTAAPDVVNLSLGISAQSSNVAEAQAQAAAAMDKVMTALTSGGVAKKDIQTQAFSIQQVTRWDNGKQQEVVIGYRVTNMVAAKLRAVDKAGATIDAVAAAGGDLTRINSISFSIDDPTAYYKEAREKAMNDAKAKAQQIAGLAGVTLGKPTYVSESSYIPPVPMPVMREASGAAAPATPISPGELEISLTVQVTFAIQ